MALVPVVHHPQSLVPAGQIVGTYLPLLGEMTQVWVGSWGVEMHRTPSHILAAMWWVLLEVPLRQLVWMKTPRLCVYGSDGAP